MARGIKVSKEVFEVEVRRLGARQGIRRFGRTPFYINGDELIACIDHPLMVDGASRDAVPTAYRLIYG